MIESYVVSNEVSFFRYLLHFQATWEIIHLFLLSMKRPTLGQLVVSAGGYAKLAVFAAYSYGFLLNVQRHSARTVRQPLSARRGTGVTLRLLMVSCKDAIRTTQEDVKKLPPCVRFRVRCLRS